MENLDAHIKSLKILLKPNFCGAWTAGLHHTLFGLCYLATSFQKHLFYLPQSVSSGNSLNITMEKNDPDGSVAMVIAKILPQTRKQTATGGTENGPTLCVTPWDFL